MLIQRLLINQIKPFLKRKEFLAIVGPRQAGKTTLLTLLKEELIKQGNKASQVEIISFEDRRLLIEFEQDPVLFVESYRKKSREKLFLLIDEFQYVEKGGQGLKLIYDTCPNLKIIITGSSSLDLRAKTGQFMVGRMLDFYLAPFNFEEFLAVKDKRILNIYKKYHWDNLFSVQIDKKIIARTDVFSNSMVKYFEEFCLWGGYPAVVLAHGQEEKQKILGEVLNKYLVRDIKDLLQLASEKNLLLLSQYLAVQMGQILVYQNLSKQAELDYLKTKHYLNILEQTFIIKLLRPFFKNRNKELSKNPKIYFMDLGFRNMLLENMSGLSKRVDSGSIVENAVFTKLNQFITDNLGKVNFWRTKSGAEVDFVLSGQGKFLPVEVKYTSMKKPEASKSLISFMKDYQIKIALVLTKDYWGTLNVKGNKKIRFMPVYYFV